MTEINKVYNLTRAQSKLVDAYRNGTRFLIVNAGKHFNSQKVASALMIVASTNGSNKSVYYVSHKRKLEAMWKHFLRFVPADWIAFINKDYRQVALRNGSMITLCTTENHYDILDNDVDFLVMDGCEKICDAVFDEVRPQLSSKYCDGRAVYIGNAPRQKWFKRLFTLGKTDDKTYLSMSFDTRGKYDRT